MAQKLDQTRGKKTAHVVDHEPPSIDDLDPGPVLLDPVRRRRVDGLVRRLVGGNSSPEVARRLVHGNTDIVRRAQLAMSYISLDCVFIGTDALDHDDLHF